MLKWTRRVRIAHFNISAPKLARNWSHMVTSVPPVWILTVQWSGARSCLFWWRHRFQIASFFPSTPDNRVFKKQVFKSLHSGESFRMAPFSVIVFSVVVWTIAVSEVKQLRLVWKRISVDGALNIHNRVNTTQSNRTHRVLTKYANRYRHTFLIYFFKLKMVNFGAYRYLNQCTQIWKIGTARNIVERSYTD